MEQILQIAEQWIEQNMDIIFVSITLILIVISIKIEPEASKLNEKAKKELNKRKNK